MKDIKMAQTVSKTADIHRMVMPSHICPYGLKALHLLKRQGYKVNDHWLETREQTDEFKTRHDVKTTPQIFIDGKRIGGYDDLRRHFGLRVPVDGETSYRPVIALFAMTALMAMAVSFAVMATPFTEHAAMWFISLSMCVLALLKLQDIDKFATMFLNYDLLAKRWIPYGYIYPFAEGLAGVLMSAGILNWVSIPMALFIGGIGAVSVFKAVYIDKRELKCACVGGGSNVPLGLISLAENLGMIGMAIWMLVRSVAM